MILSLVITGHLHFDTLHHGFHAFSLSRPSHHPNPYDGALSHSWSPTQTEAKSNFERVCQSHPLVGIYTHSPQPFCSNIFPVSMCLSSFHTYYEHAAQTSYSWAANTVAPESFSNSPKTDLSRLKWLFAIRKNTTTCIFGPQSQFTRKERTIDVLSWQLALIQEWQPRLNYPFICQFFHPRKGILKNLR